MGLQPRLLSKKAAYPNPAARHLCPQPQWPPPWTLVLRTIQVTEHHVKTNSQDRPELECLHRGPSGSSVTRNLANANSLYTTE